jgi:chaperonin GroES
MVKLISGKNSPVDPETVKFEPFSDWVLLQRIDDLVTDGGIAMPEGSGINPPRGRVIKAGPGRVTETGAAIEMPFGAGDVVWILGSGVVQPMQITLSGREFILVRARDLCGKVPA